MTRDEIKLVVFILSAFLLGALVQHCRTRIPSSSAAPTPTPHGWAKPPYVLKETKSRRAPAGDSETQ
ncbi:MAG: hypothetical protein ABI318_10180 [Chthoniobacteraceae bacterium]